MTHTDVIPAGVKSLAGHATDARQAVSGSRTSRSWLALSLVTFVVTMMVPPPIAAQQPDAVLGIWLTEPGDQGGRARVEVRKVGETFVGHIVWLEEPNFPDGPDAGKPKTDIMNPDEALQSRPVIGLELLSGMTRQADGTWGGGSIYDPANGKTYSAIMSLDNDEDDTLDLRGYVGISLFGRTTQWRRVK